MATATENETLEQYWQRKNEELAFLSRYTDRAPGKEPPKTQQAFTCAARNLRKQILVRQVEASSDVLETSLQGPHPFCLPFGSVSFSYQRYDMSTLDVDWLPQIHGRSAPGPSGGLFFCSGMGAIVAVLSALARRQWRRIRISPMAYFETHLLLRRFYTDLEHDTVEDRFSGRGADVLWLDTCSPSWPELPDKPGDTKLIVIDTSCVESSSEVLVDWLEASRRMKCPLVLVRSHLKLDTFGIELGRLGSAVLLGHPSEEASAEVAELLLELKQARASFGLTFDLSRLYPWLGDPEFERLSERRTRGIRSATELLEGSIKDAIEAEDGFEVIETEHKIFCLIRTGLRIRHAGPAILSSRVARTIAERCAAEDLPVRYGSSFGLDRIMLLDFVNMHDDLHYLRVSGADVPLSLLPRVGRHIRNTLASLARDDELDKALP